MTATTDLVRHEGAMELDSAALERALAELWQEASAAADGSPVARARVMTLVVYAEDEASAALAEQVAQTLPERHPCRGIILDVRPQESGPLRASIAIQCMVNPGGERKVCSELITVTGGTESRALLTDAVAPLLVADLPAVVWWTGRPRPADPVLRRFAGGIVDRVLLDSALFRDPGAGLIALARWLEEPRRRAAIADLSWERLRPWRTLLAQTVDSPDARAHLRQIREVVIGHGGQGSLPEETLLLAGWLASRLRWQPLDSPAAGVVTFADSGGTVTLRLAAEAGESDLTSVRLTAADGTTYAVRRSDRPGLGVCAVVGAGRTPLVRLVPLAPRGPVDLAVHALGRAGRDPVYEAALVAAAEIAVLGATA